MPVLDIFNNDAFSLTTMADAITNSSYVPNRLTALNLFDEVGITTEGIAIETDDLGATKLVPVTPRGAPVPQQSQGKRNLRNFKTTRIGQGDRILASELDFVRRFGEEQAVEMAQSEIARRLGNANNQEGILNNLGLTFEHSMLEIVKTGIFVDSNGNPLVDWGNEMRSPAEITAGTPFAIPVEQFNFATLANGDLREKLNVIRRDMARTSKGHLPRSAAVHVLVGDDFFDALGKNVEIRDYYKNNVSAALFVEGNNEWDTIRYAGFAFENYRGTDDQTTVDIVSTDGHAVPTGAGAFKHYMSHGESFGDLGTLGQKWYVDIRPDLIRDRFVDIEVTTYPLLACTKPQLLRKFELA